MPLELKEIYELKELLTEGLNALTVPAISVLQMETIIDCLDEELCCAGFYSSHVCKHCKNLGLQANMFYCKKSQKLILRLHLEDFKRCCEL